MLLSQALNKKPFKDSSVDEIKEYVKAQLKEKPGQFLFQNPCKFTINGIIFKASSFNPKSNNVSTALNLREYHGTYINHKERLNIQFQYTPGLNLEVDFESMGIDPENITYSKEYILGKDTGYEWTFVSSLEFMIN